MTDLSITDESLNLELLPLSGAERFVLCRGTLHHTVPPHPGYPHHGVAVYYCRRGDLLGWIHGLGIRHAVSGFFVVIS